MLAGGLCFGWGGRRKERYRETRTHGVPGCIDDALYAAPDGLERIGANTCGALREAFDALADFRGEVLRRLTTYGYMKRQ